MASWLVYPALAGFAAALIAGFAIVLTRRWHGAHTVDLRNEPQSVHDEPVPRIGGLAVYLGFLAAAYAAAAVRPEAREVFYALAAGGSIVFAAGLVEDLTNRFPKALRLAAGGLAALTFCLLAGYSVTRADLPFLDDAMALYPVSIVFTVFAITGLVNAINIIDGFNGLAAGSAILMLASFAVLALRAGDQVLALAAIAAIAVLAGFLVLNFPFAHVFLGDGGAYFTGLVLGALAVALTARNPGVSVWFVLVVLAYPILETLFSIARKAARNGSHPAHPDRLHLHLLLHARFTKRIMGRNGKKRLANPLTGVLLWTGPLTGLAAVLLLPPTREWALLVLALQTALYVTAYRRVSLLYRISPLLAGK